MPETVAERPYSGLQAIRASVISVQEDGGHKPKAAVVATVARMVVAAEVRAGEAPMSEPGPAAQRTGFIAALLDIPDIVIFVQTPLPDIAG